MSKYDPVADFLNYQIAHTEKESARNLHNYAGLKLQLADINERFYELRCQYEPIGSSLKAIGFDGKHVEELVREEILYFCRYMLTGRKDKELRQQPASDNDKGE